MDLFGLLGKNLSHSYSEKYFNAKFLNENISAKYNNFEIQNINEFHNIVLQNSQLKGLNVTIPYKSEIINFLDNLDPIAKEINAVNTIKITRKNNSVQTTGYNTDVNGFKHLLGKIILDKNTKVLILGTGGASKAVQFVLEQINIEYKLVSRNKHDSNVLFYSDINFDIISKYHLIVNTTPQGMFPQIEKFPDLPYNFISSKNILIDLVYNPETTLFLEKGKLQGAKTYNGIPMLYAQAEAAWEIWMS